MCQLTNETLEYLTNTKEETIDLIETLCKIPSPSNHEKEKAIFIKKWLEDKGAKNVYIDEVNNVLYPINCQNSDKVVVFMAHIDTVFPDLTPLPFTKDEKYLYSPGVGDDTTCVAMLLMVASLIIKKNLLAKTGVLFAFNSCEEGLGNLKGIKNIMKHYQNKIAQVISFDSQYDCVINDCVGSERYEVIVKTKGGHSFRDFGNDNAIAIASKLINKLYNVEVPKKEKSKTTYNVGIIKGGTSINTIAQETSFLYEYRSNSQECLKKMKENFLEIVKNFKEKDVEISFNVLGIRPCKENVDEEKLEKLTQKVINICEKHSNIKCYSYAGSTDCNIPMSMGIPSVAAGCYIGYGEHTREEKVLIESIPIGLKIVAELVLEYFD